MRFVILVQRHDGRQQYVGSAPELMALARDGEVAGMAVVSREDTGLYLDACRDWLTRAGGAVDRCVLCVRPRRPPVAFARPDQPVESFACCGPLCSHLAEALQTPGHLVSAFEVVREIMRAPRPVRVRACVQPEEIRDAVSPPGLTSTSTRPRVAWVMAHLGPRDYLRGCLDGLVLANQPLGGAILVGLDDDRPLLEAELCERAGGRAFFADPPRSGPYRIRNALIERSAADVILLQDSDDFPCEDRGVCLVEALHHSTHGMAGSHALNVDEPRRRIVPVRYPLDATAAHQRDGEDPVLPGACALRRAAFLEAGGFSTLAAYAMDSQFVLRGHFHFSTVNVDRFLYLRRIRAGSLTTDGPTMYGSLGRSRLTHAWQRDFPRVMQGRLRLAESSLCAQHPPDAAFALRVPRADSEASS